MTRASARLRHAHILLVDDQSDLAENLVEILEDEGASVERAISLAAAHQAMHPELDVALVDIHLPDGSGMDLIAPLKAACPGVEVLFMTGMTSLKDIIELMNRGAYAYLSKPFGPEALLEHLERAIRQTRSTRHERLLQQRLHQERDFIDAILQTAGALVLVTDKDGRIVRFNRTCEEISGLQADQLRGRPVEDLQPFGNNHHVRFDEILRGLAKQRLYKQETTWRHVNGTCATIEWTHTALRSETGDLDFVVSTGLDITERERANAALAEAHERLQEEQAKLLQAEKLSSIGLLASGVAHEINNPLSGIMGCFRALRSDTLAADRRQEYEVTIADGLERIRRIVRSLLDYARQREPAPAAVPLARIIDPTLQLLAAPLRKKCVDIDTSALDSRLEIYADRPQLMQALLNVMLNALQASPKRGTIRLATTATDERIGLHIIDQGSGIPQDIRDKVCDPFFSTKPEGEGTGLGLSISLGILRANDGDLELGGDHQGADIVLWVPRARA